MGILISNYINEVQKLMATAFKEAEKQGVHGGIFESHIVDIILRGVFVKAKNIQREIYNKVEKIEGVCYGVDSNEMIMLGAATILTAWSAWVFKAKSEDEKRANESRKAALAVNRHLQSLIINAINAGEEIGINSKTPENVEKYIGVTHDPDPVKIIEINDD